MVYFISEYKEDNRRQPDAYAKITSFQRNLSFNGHKFVSVFWCLLMLPKKHVYYKAKKVYMLPKFPMTLKLKEDRLIHKIYASLR